MFLRFTIEFAAGSSYVLPPSGFTGVYDDGVSHKSPFVSLWTRIHFLTLMYFVLPELTPYVGSSSFSSTSVPCGISFCLIFVYQYASLSLVWVIPLTNLK